MLSLKFRRTHWQATKEINHSGFTRGLKKIIKPSTAVAVAKERQSFAGGLNHRALTGKVLVVLGVCTWRFDFLFFFHSVYICSQITVDVETSFSDAIFSGLLVARFCPLLSLLICAGHLSEIIWFLLLNKLCKNRDHGLFMSILLLTAS